MEGLIPFVYKAIMQYKNGKEGPNIGSWLCDSSSPSYSYMKLPGDSGRFQTSASSLFGSSASSPPPSGGVQSPRRRLNSHRVST